MDAECTDGKLGRGKKNQSLHKSVRPLARSVTLNFPLFNELETEFEDTEGARRLEIKAVIPCFQIACLLKKYRIKRSLISSKGMCGWPLCIQNGRMACQTPTCDRHQSVFHFSLLFYITVLKVIEKKTLFPKGPLRLKWWPEPTPNNALQDTV